MNSPIASSEHSHGATPNRRLMPEDRQVYELRRQTRGRAIDLLAQAVQLADKADADAHAHAERAASIAASKVSLRHQPDQWQRAAQGQQAAVADQNAYGEATGVVVPAAPDQLSAARSMVDQSYNERNAA